MKKKLSGSVLALAFLFCVTTNSYAQEAFLGEVKLVAFNFTPRGFADCSGQLLPINQNQALFALLGTMYGGDGRTTFALPDMRGRVAVGVGKAPDLEEVRQGEKDNGKPIPAVGSNDAAGNATPYTGLKYVICVQGIFPSRN